jgi:RNA polymerase sigma factor (sigma-70 family)
MWLRRGGILDPEAADDVLDRVLSKLHLKRDTLSYLAGQDSVSHVHAYLTTMVRNAVLDYGRECGRRTPPLDALKDLPRADQGAPSPGELAERKDSFEKLRGVLASALTEEERQLLEMRFWEDRPIKEIASITGVAYHTAAQRLYRLQKKLRAILADPPA